MRNATRRLAELLVAWRIPLLVATLLLSATALIPAVRLQFDRSIENMFASSDPLRESYRKLRELFIGNEIVVAVYEDKDLLHPDGRGIRRLAGISDRLEQVPGVEGVLSLDQPMGEAVADPHSPRGTRVRQLLKGFTHSEDGKTAAIGCILIPETQTSVPREETVRGIRRIVGSLPMGMVAGEPVMVVDGFRYIEKDGFRLGWSTTLLLGLMIVLSFRSLRWVLIPIAVVQLAILLTRATVVLFDLRLSMVSSVLTAVVTVIGVAAVMHIIVRVREIRLEGVSAAEALTATLATLMVPAFWASTTDTAGFLSLTAARIGPVQDFGIMMALGATFVMVGLVTLIPGMALLGGGGPGPRLAWGERYMGAILRRCAEQAQRRPVAIALVTLVVVGVAAIGNARLEVETDFTENFRERSPIVRSYKYIESHLGGAGVWDVILPAPERPTWDYYQRVQRLEARLRREVLVGDASGRRSPGLTATISLPGVVAAAAPPSLIGSLNPSTANVVLGVALKRLENEMPVLVRLLQGQDPQGRKYYRIMLRSPERQPAAQKRHTIDQVRRIAEEEFPAGPDAPGAEVAGFFVLLTYIIDSILRDQWITFAVATGSIGLMMLVAFRSLPLSLAAMVPNLLPIFVVTGFMGWAGIKSNMGTAMIAAVSVGLSIDSSIHFLTSYRRERLAGTSVGEALTTVHETVGRAEVFATLALVVGFLVLATSEFVPTIYFGVLVSLTMLGGLLGNLIVLPVLLALGARLHAAVGHRAVAAASPQPLPRAAHSSRVSGGRT